jgi:GTP-binding protein HflX
LLEHPQKTILVNVRDSGRDDADALREFRELVEAAGAVVVGSVDAPQKHMQSRFLVGEGKAREIAEAVAEQCADLAVFNRPLSPAQVRNLEDATKTRVIDRIDLILDIFARRARSFEGKLQVELAQLEHLSTRLVRGWTHLERQKGGIGLRGPGETQLETDRRLIARRIRQIQARLDKVQRQRRDSSRARRRANLSTVSLVGYTNAGKSTLFNTLTRAEVYVADQLFATLDTTLRRLQIPGENPILMSDTVGFVRELPHELIAAFHATLEETRDATLLLHVIDASAPDRDERALEVRRVLEEIGAGSVPTVEVYNKIDKLIGVAPHVVRDADGVVRAVWLSAVDDSASALLRGVIAEHLNRDKQRRWVEIPAAAGRLRARLYAMGAVFGEVPLADGWALEVALNAHRVRLLWAAEGLPIPAPVSVPAEVAS